MSWQQLPDIKSSSHAALEHGMLELSKRSIALKSLTLPVSSAVTASRFTEFQSSGQEEGQLRPSASLSRTPSVVLVHGSLHGAWAWEPLLLRWMECGGLGSPALAVTLRGYTSSPPLKPGVATSVKENVDDIIAVVKHVTAVENIPPILVGHSIGGYYCQRAALTMAPGSVSGLVLLASTPPSGNSALAWRNLRKNGIGYAWKLTMGFVRNMVATDIDICREMFFSKKSIPSPAAAALPASEDSAATNNYDMDIEGDAVLRGYMDLFGQAAQNKVDTREIKPLRKEHIDLRQHVPRVLVMGGADDTIVDEQAIRETAEFWGVANQYRMFANAPHDLMLSSGRDQVADFILTWILESKD